MKEHSKFERALWWLAQEFAVVPLQPRSKYLQKGFGAHSGRLTTEAAAHKWFIRREANLGVVLGQPPKRGLAVADFDDVAAYEQWRAGAGKNVNTLTETTGRGRHVFFVGDNLPSGHAPKVEFKTGGVVMVAPSIHPTGKVYEVLHDAPIATLTPPEAQALFPFVSFVLAAASRPASPEGIAHPSTRAQVKVEGGGDLIARIKAARKVSEEARALTALQGRDDHYYGKCPFHEDAHASFWVDDEAGIWGCYSPNCPTNARGAKAHDIINLRALAKHLSVKEAVKDLADELFPRPMKKQPRRK